MRPDPLPDLDTSKRLILELGRLGVRLGTNGPRITFDAPPGVLTEDTRELIKTNRHIIHDLLRREAIKGGELKAAPILPKRPLPPQSRLHCLYPTHTDWLSIYGARICRICHPPAAAHLVAKELA